MQNILCGVVVFCSPYLEKSVCQCCVFVAVDCLFDCLSNSVIDFVAFFVFVCVLWLIYAIIIHHPSPKIH